MARGPQTKLLIPHKYITSIKKYIQLHNQISKKQLNVGCLWCLRDSLSVENSTMHSIILEISQGFERKPFKQSIVRQS